jgi:hypothetical protein
VSIVGDCGRRGAVVIAADEVQQMRGERGRDRGPGADPEPQPDRRQSRVVEPAGEVDRLRQPRQAGGEHDDAGRVTPPRVL